VFNTARNQRTCDFACRADFITLPFQAIQCYLDNIAPPDGKSTDLLCDDASRSNLSLVLLVGFATSPASVLPRRSAPRRIIRLVAGDLQFLESWVINYCIESVVWELGVHCSP